MRKIQILIIIFYFYRDKRVLFFLVPPFVGNMKQESLIAPLLIPSYITSLFPINSFIVALHIIDTKNSLSESNPKVNIYTKFIPLHI